MSARDRHEFEYRKALEAEQAEDSESAQPSARQRFEHQAAWVELQVKAAIERGEFDGLPGAGKPLPDVDRPHDPDWWVRRLIEREQITGVLPPALGLRKEDAELDASLDRWARESDVRREVEQFNRRVIDARRQLQGGPPVITPTRDVEDEVTRWSARRTARLRAARERSEAEQPQRPRRWFISRRRR